MGKAGVDRVVKLICVVGYFTIWLIVLSKGFNSPQLAPALLLASVYAGMNYYEMSVREHLGLSADSTAIPVTFLVVVIGAIAAHFGGIQRREILEFVLNVPFAWLGGHVLVVGVFSSWISSALTNPKLEGTPSLPSF
jgi:hypothetical protein